MSRVIPKPYSHQASYKQTKQTRLVAWLKPSQAVSYSPHYKFYNSRAERLKHPSLVVLVNPSFLHGTEATERGLRASFEDVSISRTRLSPQQQNVNKFLVSPANREEDVLDWDFYLENPPLKPAATIELEFEYRGRSQPIPVTDPWDE